jgi:hypothetical protein
LSSKKQPEAAVVAISSCCPGKSQIHQFSLYQSYPHLHFHPLSFNSYQSRTHPLLLPTAGLRQGCPLSPYLFVIAINELSLRLQDELNASHLQGVSLAPGAPPIHCLLFADDLIICGNASQDEAAATKTILYDFCRESGQTPNLNKSSILFSHNVPTYIKHQITSIFPVPNLIPNTMHLGHPMIFTHKDKNRA